MLRRSLKMAAWLGGRISGSGRFELTEPVRTEWRDVEELRATISNA